QSDLEAPDERLKFLGLCRELRRRRRRLLRALAALHRDRVDLLNALRDLDGRGALLLRGSDNAAERVARLARVLHAALDLLRARLHAARRVLGLALDLADARAHLLGGLCGALGELAHFVGDHREPATVLTRARRLDRGVEREKVRL